LGGEPGEPQRTERDSAAASTWRTYWLALLHGALHGAAALIARLEHLGHTVIIDPAA
jgi:hypothetical protein